MALSAVKLTIAGAISSKNSYINGLLGELQIYNAISRSEKQKKADALVRVMQIVGWYLTSKPPQPKAKNKLRWDACHALAKQADTDAAALGVRLMSGPTNFKTIDQQHKNQSYWLELLDPQHRPGYALAPKWQGWLNNPGAIAAKKSFWEFIGTDFNPAEFNVLVKYYPQSTVYSNADSLLHFNGNVLEDCHDINFDSRLNTTHFSGTGWAIFVVSPDNRLFAGSHVVGQHHHSSFLGGGAVIAAGEMVVDNGRVQIITAKSGHYKPSPENMRNYVNQEHRIPNWALIRPDLRDTAGGGQPKFYKVGDYRSNGPAATPVTKQQLLGRLPPFARSAEFRASTFNKI